MHLVAAAAAASAAALQPAVAARLTESKSLGALPHHLCTLQDLLSHAVTILVQRQAADTDCTRCLTRAV